MIKRKAVKKKTAQSLITYCSSSTLHSTYYRKYAEHRKYSFTWRNTYLQKHFSLIF